MLCLGTGPDDGHLGTEGGPSSSEELQLETCQDSTEVASSGGQGWSLSPAGTLSSKCDPHGPRKGRQHPDQAQRQTGHGRYACLFISFVFFWGVKILSASQKCVVKDGIRKWWLSGKNIIFQEKKCKVLLMKSS